MSEITKGERKKVRNCFEQKKANKTNNDNQKKKKDRRKFNRIIEETKRDRTCTKDNPI